MGPAHQTLSDRATARLDAFGLIQDIQSGNPGAAAELERLTLMADAEGYPEVARVGLFGRAVEAWMSQDGTLSTAVDELIGRSRRDGDMTMIALGLALRAAFINAVDDPTTAASVDADLAEAVAILDHADGPALEMISAHTACGIAFDVRSLWELGDEQYGAAFDHRAEAEPGIGEVLLAAVMFNRAEAQVSWAGKLRQVGDSARLADRWESWRTVPSLTRAFTMPASWRTELDALGLVMAAIAGEDVAAEVEREMASLNAENRQEPRTTSHFKLALALSSHNAGRPGTGAAVAEALEAVDPEVFPLMFDLALYLAAEVEAAQGWSAGLRRAQREINHRWTERLTQVAAMRARIEAERLRPVIDRLSREANLDDLTGLANRRRLATYSADLGRRDVDRIALIMVDIDGFKAVNDRHGHGVGDAVLVRIARILELGVRPVDLPTRIGGDEFLLALASVDGEVALLRAERLMEEIDRQIWTDLAPGLDISLSMGVAAGPGSAFDEVRISADQAVYRAKRSGGHAIVAGDS